MSRSCSANTSSLKDYRRQPTISPLNRLVGLCDAATSRASWSGCRRNPSAASASSCHITGSISDNFPQAYPASEMLRTVAV